MADRRMCARCVLSESQPDIWLGDDGVCNICADWQVEQQAVRTQARQFLETDLTRLLTRHRGHGPYDCLVMLSGGKDSTSALYHVVRRYRLRPLAFTFNHGFVPDEHLRIVRRVVAALGVDWLYFESPFMHDMFREIVRSGSGTVICPVCSLWYMMTTYRIAARWGIPLIISGWTKGQTTSSTASALTTCACNQTSREHRSMARATQQFMQGAVRACEKYRDFPTNMEEVLLIARKRLKTKAMALSPHWFLPMDAAEYVETIKDELGWSYPSRSYPIGTTNCDLNFLATWLALRDYGYSHYHIELSNLVRRGLMTRDEALRALDSTSIDRGLLEPILQRLGLTFEGLQPR